MCAATGLFKNVAPRAAARLDVAPITDVTAILGGEGDTFERPMYAGSALATVRSADALKVLTVRPTSFDKAAVAAAGGAAVEDVSAAALGGDGDGAPAATWLSDEVARSERPGLASAPAVVVEKHVDVKPGEGLRPLVLAMGQRANTGNRSALMAALEAALAAAGL